MLRGIARILTSCRTPKMLVEVGMLKRIPWVVIRFFCGPSHPSLVRQQRVPSCYCLQLPTLHSTRAPVSKFANLVPEILQTAARD